MREQGEGSEGGPLSLTGAVGEREGLAYMGWGVEGVASGQSHGLAWT